VKCCNQCKHFWQLGDQYGKCRRYPPVLIAAKYIETHLQGLAQLYDFPVLRDDQLCGEWTKRPGEAR
jgi:hypothetical protein